ncbi:hypothetical protein VKI21_10675 [Cyanobacterium aponinum UTEX 3222]|uniref:hypothetical protein n=1 Tax=Cyanobacterium aponinum TaxID=379064 RepID=UPI002B4BD8EF|nr:hypothetical protein [Cyanobacterium aponinum]WRL39157.1 hypothetical protein VKI22_03395 [Cyanobacterium aponinum UTEX 3221]WRL40535.1 hypothetical protein VKI21_10675 [Cyanobacterium aponinum UTEX 3222]
MNINSSLKILLLSSPAVIGTLFLNLVYGDSVQALDLSNSEGSISTSNPSPSNLNCDRSFCTGNQYLAAFPQVDQQESVNQFPNVEQNEEGHLLLDVTEEESDTAVQMFGCDCVKAINALRQLRGIPVGVEGDRILPGPLIRPCTQRLPST